MGKENKSYRIRTNVNNDSVVNFTVDNTIDTLDILSLSIDQKNTYRLMGSNTGIIAGRVLANGGFGVPNVKVSVFIPYETTEDIDKQILYSFSSTRSTDSNGVRYNLLPNELDDKCHQNIGTFPSKRVLLDNNNWIDVFDKYYQFTTRTNESGDYMIYGVPVGTQTVHMDVDLSDIGILSQKPRDLIYKGYNANMFENTTKFKVDTNIDSLAQVITQDQSIYVYPFWGDTTDTQTNAAITRCDMNINYKFEPTCIFMGSVVTDAGENAMSQKCVGGKKQGNMSDMITGEGKIEMIRKTPNGQVEQFSVQGDNNINSDGVWCYQIPMNLDYVMTDEFGKMVMTDNPNTGIPTRARVRFRLSMAETPSDVTARKRARFLIPNNPHLMESDYPNFTETKEIDYEFGTKTKDENFRDLMWNNVYTVKSYIPRLQKSRLPNNLRHLGIKMVNHSGANNPMPFNNLRIKFNFIYMFLCTLVKVLVTLTRVLNSVLTFMGGIFYEIGKIFYHTSKEFNIDLGIFGHPFDGIARLLAKYKNRGIRDDDGTTADSYMVAVYNDIKNNTSVCGGVATFFFKLFLNIGCGVTLSGLCETDDGTEINVSPGTNNKVKDILKKNGIATCNDRVDVLYNCIENQLAQDNEVTSFNFYNDWVNGVVYLPLWYRKIKKRRNGDIRKDKWCSTDNTIIQTRNWKRNLKLYSTNMVQRTVSLPTGKTMGKINPLVNNENTVLLSSADNETGRESMIFSKYDNDNCYGYQCHKYARSYFKVYKGLIYEKETMLGDKVYYYKPCDYDTSTGNSDLVTLFATDLVLLGSLNECDMHGIPQFFKCLESTTYNMPPDLLSESYDYTNENNATSVDEDDDSEIDLGSRMTEYTGADWGNLGVDQSNDPNKGGDGVNENEYDNGGLFYGLTCFDSYTKPKSTINLPRICELGVSLDESNELPSSDGTSTESDTDNLTPDGFVSYDEIYNPDYRSMFATLNSNFLRTKLNPETGLLEYDFNHIYLDNFDGSLELLMRAKTVNGKTEKSDFQEKANYVGNYNLEKSSDTYLNFRYGDYVKRNNKKIYFYENNNISAKVATTKGMVTVDGKNRQPRFENSFYFYFGLNEGKTAIDKFNNEFFSDCANNFASDVPYDMTYQGNSWCPLYALDGFIAFNMNVDAPYTVKFTNKDTNDVYYQTSINQSKFIFCGTEEVPEGYDKYTVYTLNNDDSNVPFDIIPTGRYTIEISDAYDNYYYDDITFELPRIGFVCDVYPFNFKNAELMQRFAGNTTAETYANIANEGEFKDKPNSIIYTAYTIGEYIAVNGVYYYKQGSIYEERTNTTGVPLYVNEEKRYYYQHDPEIPRDIYGFVALSDISEKDFRITLKPIDTDFFGGDYIGSSLDVHIDENNNISVSENHPSSTPPDVCGYLGYIEYNDTVTFYLGVPYGGKRYSVKITQLCLQDPSTPDIWVESKNTTTINVIVYEDEFKMYINGIDYDLISEFKGGWSDYYLRSGDFKESDETTDSTFNTQNLYGWNDILNIGKYVYGGSVKLLEPVTYMHTTASQTSVSELIAICDILSTGYSGNGTGNQTPYHWTDDYCYNAPSDDVNYYTTGTVQKTEYSYTITQGVTLYDVNGVQVTQPIHDETYYVDQNHTIEAVLGEDYTENVTNSEVTLTRTDKSIEYKEYDNNEYLFNGSIYYLYPNGGVQIEVSGYPNGVRVSVFKASHGYSEIYYQLSEPEYSADYKDGNNIVILTEDNNGDIIYLSSGNNEYSDYDGMTFYEYRVVVDNINTVINSRGEFARTVAGTFRINVGDTMLNITTKTKARPVRYLITGNMEISAANSLYTYRPNSSLTPTTGSAMLKINTVADINNTKYTAISDIITIDKGYVVDQNFDTSSLGFRLATLTYGCFIEYDDNEIVSNGDLYYTLENGVYKLGVVSWSNVSQRPTSYTMLEYKRVKGITDTVYKYVEEYGTSSNSDYMAYQTGGVNKHPYYVSVINDNNSIIPPSDDITNFADNGTDKNLDNMFGIHFYNKPLKNEFQMIFAFINNIPAYPKYTLADDTVCGWRYNIQRYTYDISEYTDNTVLLSTNTIVYGSTINNPEQYVYYKVIALSGETVGSIKTNHSWDSLWHFDMQQYNESDNPKLYKGYVVYYNTTNNINVYTKDIIKTEQTLYDYIHGPIITDTPYQVCYVGGGNNPLSFNNTCIKLTRYFEYDVNATIKTGDVLYEYDSNNGTYTPFHTVSGNGLLSRYKATHSEINWPAKIYGYGNCYFMSTTDCCDNANADKWVVREEVVNGNITVIYNNGGAVCYSLFDDNSMQMALTLKTAFTNNEIYYVKSPDNSGNNVYEQHTGPAQTSDIINQYGIDNLYGIYVTNVSSRSGQYYGVVFNSASVTDAWKAVDVFMPGFITGYLCNGIPRDTSKSNIKAELVGQEIKLYTKNTNENADVYENINVKRMIYTDYTSSQHPTYGVYTGVDVDSSQLYRYQYAEVPLADDDLIYTDGYGSEYRYPIKGTMAVLIDNPIFTGNNNVKLLDDIDTKYDDFLKTRTFYVSDDGYTRHQSLYYVFDMDKTPYPLYYYNTNNPQSTLDSNLKYDESTQTYYFEEMPELLLNIDNKSVSKYVSKSKVIKFNVTNYIREKYNLQSGQTDIPLQISHPRDKFFVIACCDGYYTISPVAETQWFRLLVNYNGFDNRYEATNSIYITARDSRDYTSEDTLKGGIHYIEDFYYMLYYRFTVRVSVYNQETNDYNNDMYSQVCSVLENTAEHCYIKVTDKDKPNIYEYRPYLTGDVIPANTLFYWLKNGVYEEHIQQSPVSIVAAFSGWFYYKIRNPYGAYNIGDTISVGEKYYVFETNPNGTYPPRIFVEHTNNTAQPIEVETPDTYYYGIPDYEYWASAIRINLSSLGTDAMENNGRILPWLHFLIEDKSGVIRKCNAQMSSGREGEGVEIKVFADKEAMMNDYNNYHHN